MRLGGKVQCPVTGFPVINAAEIKLRQRAQHGLSGGCNQKRPMREFGGREFATFPDFTRRIYQQVAAIFTADQSCAFDRAGPRCPPTQVKSVRPKQVLLIIQRSRLSQ